MSYFYYRLFNIIYIYVLGNHFSFSLKKKLFQFSLPLVRLKLKVIYIFCKGLKYDLKHRLILF